MHYYVGFSQIRSQLIINWTLNFLIILLPEQTTHPLVFWGSCKLLCSRKKCAMKIKKSKQRKVKSDRRFLLCINHVKNYKVIQRIQRVEINKSSRYNHVHPLIMLQHTSYMQYTTFLPTSQ